MSKIHTATYLLYAAECVRRFGYVKTKGKEESTKDRALRYYRNDTGEVPDTAADAERKASNFDADSEETLSMVMSAMRWLIREYGKNDYINALANACMKEYQDDEKDLSLLASLCPSYAKANGKICSPLSVKVKDIDRAVRWTDSYGEHNLYKITDEKGRTFIWKTKKDLPRDTKRLVGDVKGNVFFNGCPATELTRCRY